MNAPADSSALLRSYAEHRSEPAFAALVRQNLNLVYSVALRRCNGRSALAQEVCQLVFIDLARKATSFPTGLSLPGWLHQHTCFVSAKQLRAESRRHRREGIAMELQALDEEPDWSRLAPVLDSALLELPPSDREPLVLRFFGQQSFGQIGAELGLTENAARMRVDRGLDKLRARLARQGVTSTASALAAALTGPAVTSAPAALAFSITTAALTATPTFGILSVMACAFTKLELATVTVALAAAGTTFLLQHRAERRLNAENSVLQQHFERLRQEAAVQHHAATMGTPEIALWSETQAELLRLRGQVAALRNQVAEQQRKEIDHDAPRETASVLPDRPGEPFVLGGDFVPLERLGNAGLSTPEAAAMTILWASYSKNSKLLEETLEPPNLEFTPLLADLNFGLQSRADIPTRNTTPLNGVEAIRVDAIKLSSQNPGEAHLEFSLKRPALVQGMETETFVMPLKLIAGTWRQHRSDQSELVNASSGTGDRP